jgi:hypothetical protein
MEWTAYHQILRARPRFAESHPLGAVRRVALGLIFASSLLACVDAPELGESSAELGPGSGDRENGRNALGALADGLLGQTGSQHLTGSLMGVVLAGAPISLAVRETASAGPCLSVNGATCLASDPAGAILKGGNGLVDRLKIESAAQFTNSVGQTMIGYVIKHNATWANGGTPTWESYCVNDRLAYPVSGRVNRDGTFTPDRTVTFACSEYTSAGVRPVATDELIGNGVVAKVQSWGFLRGGSFSNWAAMGISGDELFQIATHAVRADYCSDGTPHSMDGTAINITDLITANATRDPVGDIDPSPTNDGTPIEMRPGKRPLEAIWGGRRLLCLSKLRWQALPVGDRCTAGTPLRDPRRSNSTTGGRFCEDYNLLAAAATHGAMLVVQRAWNDVGLWRWKHPANGDHYTTTLGHYSGAHGGDVAPAAGYTTATTPLHLGTLITSTGFATLSAAYGVDAGVTTMLRSCKGGADWATATTLAMPSGYSVGCKDEGRLWTTLPAASVSATLGWEFDDLLLWEKNGATTEHLTTTATGVPGYHRVATLGWVLRAPTW